jgi:hypothetical protein
LSGRSTEWLPLKATAHLPKKASFLHLAGVIDLSVSDIFLECQDSHAGVGRTELKRAKAFSLFI